MNRTKIEWTDFTWNPVTGCLHGCPYCYARKIAVRFKRAFPNGFEPTFHPDRLNEPIKRKKPAKIFVVDMGDLFGDWVPREWINAVLDVVRACPQHIFQFLTKAPRNLWKGEPWPKNAWVGATATNQEEADKGIAGLATSGASIKFLSCEPFLGPISLQYEMYKLDWIIIGAQTNPEKQPKKEWVQLLLDEADYLKIPVFMKDNLRWGERIREFPTALGGEHDGENCA